MPLPELSTWLVEEIEAKRPIPELFESFCALLTHRGLPVWRASLGLEALHPEESGSLVVWRDGVLDRKPSIARAGVLTNPSYLNSPTYLVDQSEKPFRWRVPAASGALPLIDELAAEGMTDYVMLPLPTLDSTRSAVASFATRVPGGFDEAALAELSAASRLITPLAERMILRQIADNLLQAYLGKGSGYRVYRGQIERGDVETITAAILISDLRGFTALSESLPRRQVVALLNRWFDVIGAAIEAQDGEILKFLGDGLLAVFPVGAGAAPNIVCDRALQAALDAASGCERLNAELAGEGRPPLRFGLALHLGEVEFGNVGTRQRLDFTVIGPAVNHASRIEGATKTLGEPLVASAAFAAATRLPMKALGMLGLRGIEEPVALFAPTRPAPARAGGA